MGKKQVNELVIDLSDVVSMPECIELEKSDWMTDVPDPLEWVVPLASNNARMGDPRLLKRDSPDPDNAAKTIRTSAYTVLDLYQVYALYCARTQMRGKSMRQLMVDALAYYLCHVSKDQLQSAALDLIGDHTGLVSEYRDTAEQIYASFEYCVMLQRRFPSSGQQSTYVWLTMPSTGTLVSCKRRGALTTEDCNEYRLVPVYTTDDIIEDCLGSYELEQTHKHDTGDEIQYTITVAAEMQPGVRSISYQSIRYPYRVKVDGLIQHLLSVCAAQDKEKEE